MIRKIRRDNVRSRLLHRLVDIALNWLALALAYGVKEGFDLGVPTEPLTPAVVLSTLAVVALVWLAVCSALETYTYKRRLFGEIVNLIAALGITIAFFTTYVYFTRPFDADFKYPRFVLLFYGGIGAVLLTLSRAIKHTLQASFHRRGIGVRRVVIVGTGPTARRLATAFRNNHALGYRFCGFVSVPDRDGGQMPGLQAGEPPSLLTGGRPAPRRSEAPAVGVAGMPAVQARGPRAADGMLAVQAGEMPDPREDEVPAAGGTPAEREAPAPPRRHLGPLERLERIISRTRADEIIVALPGNNHEQVVRIAHRCQAHNVLLRVVPDLFDVVMIRATISEIDDIPLIGLRDPVITGYQSIVKRCFDIAVASFCILLALPLFIIIPLAIWLDSRGRSLFCQVRVGENGKPFRMYKFRSMVQDAEQRLGELINIEELPEPVFKIPNDPRVTRVGRFLRRTSLDELPQLLNVLKGDMSMVGPRPEELQVVQHYQLWHRKRLSIKPGITGPMQVSGRGELPLDERIKLELMYISQYSILEDVKYLLKTIPAVCRSRGAY